MKMEPNKLEEQFRQKLEQRTIQPSEMAWDRLDAMLSVTEEKKPNRTWMYMAASFLVFATLGAFFLTKGGDDTSTIEQNSVVTNETKPAEINETIPTLQEVAAPEGTLQETKEQVALVQPTNARQKPSVKTGQQNTETVQSPANEIASVDKTGVTIVPQEEAAQLVAAAMPQETSKKKSSLKVDPNSLLSSVEGELDESFREKAYKGVVKNFNAVKTAVVNRNYQ